jgi:hypothetical protein
MKASGCNAISYGFESFDATVLKSMHKPITPKGIDRAFQLTRKHGIVVQANFIFGDIAETVESVDRTLTYWKSCKGQINLDVIRPYPGSEIYKYCCDQGIIRDRLKFIKSELIEGLPINFTHSMSEQQYRQMLNKVHQYIRNYSRYIKYQWLQSSEKRYQMVVECPECNYQFRLNNLQFSQVLFLRFSCICRRCAMRFVVLSPLANLIVIFLRVFPWLPQPGTITYYIRRIKAWMFKFRR